MDGYLEIIRADGKVEQHPLLYTRVTVGRSIDASIPLPDVPELEPLHLLLAPRDDGCWVSSAKGARTKTMWQGRIFENGLVPWGSELDAGSVTFRLTTHQPTGRSRREWVKLLRKITMLGVCAWLLWGLLGRSNEPMHSGAKPPPLFPEQSQVGTCPESDSKAAGHAGDALEAARAKAETYSFKPFDGVQAVRLYDLAVACFQAAGKTNTDEGAEARHERARLRKRVEDDYRLRCLRVENSIKYERWEEALAASLIVADMLRDRDGAYPQWLAQAQRALQIRISQSKKDKKDNKK
jgi:hypothetical protein